MALPVAIALGLVAAAPPTFKAYTSPELELPVPPGWTIDLSVSQPSPKIVAKGRGCSNVIWFDFFFGVTVELAKRLIETESVDVTAAIRRWDEHVYREIQLARHPAVQLRSGANLADRTVYLVASEGGVLVAQAMANREKAELCVPLHDDIATKLVELFFAPAVQEKVRRLAKTKEPPQRKEVEAVPKDLEEALVMLEKRASPAALADIKASNEGQMLRLYVDAGRDIRNRWGLWGGSPLAKFFNAQGVLHPDDMSRIILRSFWRRVHAQPIELEAQTAVAKRYWDLRGPPPAAKPCADGGVPKALFGLEAPDRFVHIYACGRACFAWELDAGWYEPDEKLHERIKKLRKTPGLIEADLEEPPAAR